MPAVIWSRQTPSGATGYRNCWVTVLSTNQSQKKKRTCRSAWCATTACRANSRPERLMSYASRFGEASRRAEAFRLIVITDQNNQNNSLDKSETVRDNSLQWIWVFYQDL
jgi:hypothetical protein